MWLYESEYFVGELSSKVGKEHPHFYVAEIVFHGQSLQGCPQIYVAENVFQEQGLFHERTPSHSM